MNGEDASGRDLWTTVLNSAVVLTENHRAKLDPAYAELLRLLREGTTDAALWRTVTTALRSRAKTAARHSQRADTAWACLARAAAASRNGVMPPAPAHKMAQVLRNACRRQLTEAWRAWSEQPPEKVVIVPRNADRIAINTAYARKIVKARNAAARRRTGARGHAAGAHPGQREGPPPPRASWRERGVLLIDAVFHRYKPYDRDAQRYGAKWQSTWRRITDESADLQGKYAPVLRVIIGKRYMLTQNGNVSHGVANGMWAIVRDVQLRPRATPRWDAAEGCFRVDADQVECVIVRYADREWSSLQLHPRLPAGHFLLAPDTPKTAPAGCKVFQLALGRNTKKFRITQLPLIQVRAACAHPAHTRAPTKHSRARPYSPHVNAHNTAGTRSVGAQSAGTDHAEHRAFAPLPFWLQGRAALCSAPAGVVLHSCESHEDALGTAAGDKEAAARAHADEAARRAGRDGAAACAARRNRHARPWHAQHGCR